MCRCPGRCAGMAQVAACRAARAGKTTFDPIIATIASALSAGAKRGLLMKGGKTPVAKFRDKTPLGLIAMRDEPRANAAILRNRVTDFPATIRLSRAAMANISRNLTIALVVKAVFLVTSVPGLTVSGSRSCPIPVPQCW